MTDAGWRNTAGDSLEGGQGRVSQVDLIHVEQMVVHLNAPLHLLLGEPFMDLELLTASSWCVRDDVDL
jgi:hypothetical protein